MGRAWVRVAESAGPLRLSLLAAVLAAGCRAPGPRIELTAAERIHVLPGSGDPLRVRAVVEGQAPAGSGATVRVTVERTDPPGWKADLDPQAAPAGRPFTQEYGLRVRTAGLYRVTAQMSCPAGPPSVVRDSFVVFPGELLGGILPGHFIRDPKGPMADASERLGILPLVEPPVPGSSYLLSTARCPGVGAGEGRDAVIRVSPFEFRPVETYLEALRIHPRRVILDLREGDPFQAEALGMVALLGRRLGSYTFHGAVWQGLPSLHGLVFAERPGGKGSLAAIWSEWESPCLGNDVPAEVLDLWTGTTVPARTPRITASPTVLLSSLDPAELAKRLEAASLREWQGIAVRCSPLTEPPGGPVTVDAVVQNLRNAPFQGSLEVVPPPGWSPAKQYHVVDLAPGARAGIPFFFDRSGSRPDNLYELSARVTGPGTKVRWAARVPCVAALGLDIDIDGRADDWKGALRVPVGREGPPSPSACFRLAWGRRGIFVAVEVEEERLIPRRPGGLPGDAIQIAVGPAGGGDVSEFLVVGEGREGRDVTGRRGGNVHRLDGPRSGPRILDPIALADRILDPSRVGITRREGVSFYEVAIPWDEIPGIRPAVGERFFFSMEVFEADHPQGMISWGASAGLWPWEREAWTAWRARDLLRPLPPSWRIVSCLAGEP